MNASRAPVTYCPIHGATYWGTGYNSGMGGCRKCLEQPYRLAENRERVAAWRAANPEKARQQTREAVARYRKGGW